MKFLNNFDLFGYTYQQPYLQKQTTFKSNFGALFTISLYSLSLLYFLYKMNSWLSGNINPRSSFTYEVQDQIDLLLKYPLMKVSFDAETSKLDTLNEKEKILQIYFVTEHNKLINFTPYEPRDNKTLTLNNFNISYSKNQESQYPTDAYIMLQICNSTYQNNCASQEKINSFLNIQGIYMNIQFNCLYFNSKSNSFKEITQNYQYAIETDMTILNTIQLQIQNNIINDGLLFENLKEQQVVNNMKITTQSIKQDFFKQYFNNIIAVIVISIDPLVQIQSIQYTKISEILADVGSIVSSLMVLKFIASAMNQYLLQEYMYFQIINCYYPQFKELNIQRNIIGQIKSISHLNGEINLQDFNQFYQKAKLISQKKQTILNIIYEISRIQFLLKQILDRNQLTQIHKLGIPLQFEFNHRSNTIVPLDETIQVSEKEKNIYENEDFNILTLQNF